MAENEDEKQEQPNAESTGQSKMLDKVREKGIEELSKEAKKKFKKEATKAVAKGAAKGVAQQSMFLALGPYLLIAFLIIVAIIIIIGIAMFLVTMPGMVMEKLNEIAEEVADHVAAFFGADTTKQIKAIQIYSTLDYLEQMGWDLKGEGFLTDYNVKEDETAENTTKNLDDGETGIYDEAVGVIRNSNDEIVNAYSDFILKYLISDNYIYTLKNNNLVTHDPGHWYENLMEKIEAGALRVLLFVSDLMNAPLNDYVYGRFGKGLIAIRYEKNDEIGNEGSLVNSGITKWNWDSVSINTKNKTLSISRNGLLSTLKGIVNGKAFNNAMEFNLDGWTGRYGMPLEFLLAIHKATLMPDLAYDMVDTFGTEINILLHKVEGTAMGVYKTKSNGNQTFEELSNAILDTDGNGFFGPLIFWFKNLTMDEQRAQVAFKMGIEHSSECECEEGTVTQATYNGNLLNGSAGAYTSITINDTSYSLTQTGDNYSYTVDGNTIKFSESEVEISEEEVYTSICPKCISYVKKLLSILKSNSNPSYEAYLPYIANVKDHWYRDVYFVVNRNDGDLQFVDYDYDYQIMTGERWTLYETYTSNPNDGELYNPEKEGEFAYYVLKDDGSTGEIYEGNVAEGEVEYVKTDGTSDTMRIASIGEDGTKVIKKAKTISSSDEETLTDLGWNNSIRSNIWSAYEEDDNENYSLDPLFSDEEIEKEDDEDKQQIMGNSYIELKFNGSITQTGEGQRTETNSDIKKMFLSNNYFRYDGTDQTAEIITAFRDKLVEESGKTNERYGPIDDDVIYEDGEPREYYLDLSDSKYKSGAESGYYKLSDYVGNVTLNQDSLNAFTILENTHTLDADYIYRDFKELVVELGYFEKEELTDETPKLLQFIVPDIGSNGYPDSSIDKRENEYGTMVHSKSDIDVNKKHRIAEIISQMESCEILQGDAPETEDVSGITSADSSENLSQVSGVEESNNILEENDSKLNLKSVKGTGKKVVYERVEEEGDGYKFVVQSGNVKYIHRYQAGQSYSNTNFFWAGGSRTLGQAACGLFSCFNVLTGYGYDFDPVKDLSGYKWDATMEAVKNLMEEHDVTGQFLTTSDTDAIEEALDEGRPVIVLFGGTVDKQGVKWTKDGHFVAFVGKDSEGNILSLDSGSQSDLKRHDYPGTFADMVPAIKNTTQIWVADEAPTGANQSAGNPYEGYEGNEAVVSPVTGILLEYGTYEKVENTELTDDEGNKITTEDPRVNVDLEYGFPNIYENLSGDSEEENPDDEFESQIVSDKVGYAKILVLDAESYQKLESSTSNSWQNSSDSLVKIDQTTALADGEQVISKRTSFREALTGEVPDNKKNDDDYNYSEEYEDWSMLDKTVYGYKEFAETYEKYGIAGYVVYIDGFKCELPDDSLSGGEEAEDGSGEEAEESSGEDIESQIPHGTTLTMESFQKITQAQLTSTEAPEGEYVIESKYEPDEAYKLASEKSTNKLAAEVDLKTQASSTIYANGLTFIKEGTVIGRTLTDKELLESSDFRNGEYGTYEELRGNLANDDDDDNDDEEDNSKLIGNYLRIIMRDTDGTVVEDVENYMKLDEGGKNVSECDFEQLAYFLGCLEEGFYERNDLGSSYGVEVLQDGAGNTTAFGLTKAVAETVSGEWPSFASHLAAGTVPKDEAQDVFILVLESAKEKVQNRLTTQLEDDDPSLFALIDLHHASPEQCYEVIDVYNSKNNNLSADEMVSVFKEHWGTNETYRDQLEPRGVNRGILASEGRFLLYQTGSKGDEVIFDSETPWTDFCEANGTYEMTQESSGLYHIEKGAYTNY